MVHFRSYFINNNFICFRCIWQCPGQSLYHQCEGGQWSQEPGVTRCMCHKIGVGHPGDILCYPPVSPGSPVPSGTYCLHTCHGHTKNEMMCQHSLWSTSPNELSCEGNNLFVKKNFLLVLILMNTLCNVSIIIFLYPCAEQHLKISN